ncbi:hypothetical protein [Halosegnis longus]|uniref:Uncharacterized protein n=1 Tax=Halosegnis longus TaxID=2216012 RepID=A0AAJ4R9J0_9EURY|nr:hypothetical protein Nmn1133_10940 [Salella cibi]
MSTESSSIDALHDATPSRLAQLTRAAGTATRGLAFWTGITLAFAQVPLFAAGVTSTDPTLLVVLVVANLAALALGSDYRA